MERHALIMASGEGRRAGTEIPKQFVELLGIPMLWWSVMAFYRTDPATKIKVVLHPGFFDDWDIMLDELPAKIAAAGLPAELARIDAELVCGGRTRSESVRNGLMTVPDHDGILVAIHDAARPLVTPEIIEAAWRKAEETGNAVPAIPVSDTLRELTAEGSVTVDRSRFVAVQTPQTFSARTIHRAFLRTEGEEFTDEASRAESCGEAIFLTEGGAGNIKVTNPADLTIAEALLAKRLDK